MSNRFKKGDKVVVIKAHFYHGALQTDSNYKVGETYTVNLISPDYPARFPSGSRPHITSLEARQWIEESCLRLLGEDDDVDAEAAQLFGILPSTEVIINTIEEVDSEGWNNITRKEATALAEAILKLPWPR